MQGLGNIWGQLHSISQADPIIKATKTGFSKEDAAGLLALPAPYFLPDVIAESAANVVLAAVLSPALV